eukprot:PRCOL_00005224-RA
MPHGGGLVTALSPLSKRSGGYAADGCGPVVTGRCDSPGRDDNGGAAYYQTDTDESMAGDDPEGSARSSFVASEFLDDATTNQIVECTRVHLRQLDLSATSSTDLFELLEIDAELAKSRIEWSQLSFKRLLGSGQFGDVCHMSLRTGSDADGTKRKRDVAVKSLRPSGCIVSLNDLRCEIAVLAKLAEACNTIVGFVGWGIVDSRSHSRPASFSADTSGMDGSVGGRTLFLVEELCAGGSLAKMVALQSVGEQLYSGTDAIAWALDIARALQCLHDRPEGPITHRDLKLSNMILRPPPRARSPSKRSAISRSFTGLLSLSRRASAATGDQRPRSASGSDAHSSFSSEAGDSSTGGADWPTPPETPPATPHSPEQTTPQTRTMAVLCDFGVAKPLPERLRARRTRRSRLGPVDPADGTAPKCGPQDLGRQLLAERNFAMTGGVGSCVYCAPEMAACEPYGRRVDIYSFGVALYELLAATVVSARYGLDHPRKVERYLQRVCEESHRPPLPSGWPQSIRSLVEDCWAQDWQRRPSAAQIVRRLEAIQEAGDAEAVFLRGGGPPACSCAVM